MMCSFGVAPGTLTVLPVGRVTCDGVPMANIMDHKPTVNIAPFGMCSAPTNPAVISATSAASGVFTPAPCIPATTSPWAPGSPTVQVGGQPALNNTSTCNCTWLGVVTISSPGATTVQVA